MNGAKWTDLGLLLPELILVGTALVLVLAARRIQSAPVVTVATVLASLAALLACVWLCVGRRQDRIWGHDRRGLATPNSSRFSSPARWR